MSTTDSFSEVSILNNKSSAYAEENSVGLFYIVILVLTSSIILTLNITILIIVISAKCLGKQIRNIHILSLSFSDILVGINVIPISVILDSIVNGQPPSYHECWSRMCLYLTCLVASMFHVLIICIDRTFIILRKSLASKRNTRIRFCIAITLSWICAVVCVVAPFVLLKTERAIPYCSISTVFEPEIRIKLLRIWSLLFLTGIFVVFAACVWMVKKIMSVQPTSDSEIGNTDPCVQSTSGNIHFINVQPIRQGRCLVHRESNLGQRKIPTFQRSAIKTITMLAIGMVFCLAPLDLMILIEGWLDPSFFSTNQRHIIVYIASLNSAINPIIYAFRIQEVRESIRHFKNNMSCCHVYCICQGNYALNSS